MYYNHIYKSSVTDGPGIRVSLYVSGCRNHCPGCHNPESWCFKFGKQFDDNAKNKITNLLDKYYVRGLTLCGGEPMEEENQKELVKLLREIKRDYPTKDIWCYTGYELKDLFGRKHTEVTNELLSYIDVLVAGPFILAQRDISDNNRWRGSRNQRVIDLKETFKQKKIIYLGGIPNNDYDNEVNK